MDRLLFAGAAAVAGGYLLGAVPFSFLIARARGVDIRKTGSGNVGATNVFRSVGKGWGLLAFACDAAKGFVAAVALPPLAQAAAGAEFSSEWPGVLCAAAAIAGHTWPVFLGFRGGKGVATGAGAMLGLAPRALGAAFIVWVLCFAACRYVSAASIAAAAAFAGAAWLLYSGEGAALPAAATALCLLVIYRHKSNIRRLLQGTESKLDLSRRTRKEPEQR